MNKIVAAVCAAVLVISIHSVKCISLKTSENENTSSDEEIIKPEEYVEFLPSRVNINEEKDSAHNKDESLKRVVRQAYQGQTSSIYPNLPSGPPYGLQPYPNYNNNPNTQPAYNNPSGPYGQNTPPNAWPSNGQPAYKPYGSSNFTQPGYPNSNGYTSNNFTQNPTGPYGQYPQQPQPSWQPNGQRPNYNNPYGSNTQGGQYNYTQPGYPISNGYKPSNFSHNTPGPYGQTTPSSNSWQNPHPNNNGQRPYGNNNATTPYFGYKPTTNNNPSGRPPYYQPVPSSYNNSYPGYPSHTAPSPYPGYSGQKAPYYPSQSPSNNTGNHPVIYDDSTRRPGQGYNATSWNGNTLNNTQGRPPFNSGHNPQYFNSYPGSTGQGQQNTTNPYNIQPQIPPYQNPNYGQYAPSSYPGQSPNSATFNMANSGYNPSIPNKPPYGSPYGNGPYGNNNQNQFQHPNGTSHDPTKVAPQYFNSY